MTIVARLTRRQLIPHRRRWLRLVGGLSPGQAALFANENTPAVYDGQLVWMPGSGECEVWRTSPYDRAKDPLDHMFDVELNR